MPETDLVTFTANEAVNARNTRMKEANTTAFPHVWTREGVEELTRICFEMTAIRQALQRIADAK